MSGRSRTVLSPIPSNASADGHPFGQELLRNPHASRPRQRSYLTGRRKMRADDSQDQRPTAAAAMMGRKPKVATVEVAASGSSSFSYSSPFHDLPAMAVSAMRNLRAKATAGVKRKRGGAVALQPSTRRGADVGEPSRRASKTTASGPSAVSAVKGKLVSSVSTASSVASSGRAQASADGSSPRSLRRGMGDMALSDRAESPESMLLAAECKAGRGRVLPARASTQRKASGSGSRPTNMSRRSSRASKATQSGEDEDDEIDGDEAHEDDHYLYTALNWQLLRLKKSDLMRLHHRLGTFKAEKDTDPELYTKQELADEIIKARSRPDSRRPKTPEKPTRRPRTRSSPRHSWSTMDSERDSPTLSEQRQHSDEDQDDERATQTDANDGGGEETEAEPGRARRRRRVKAARASSPTRSDDEDDSAASASDGGRSEVDPDKTPRERSRPRASRTRSQTITSGKSGSLSNLPGLNVPRLRGGSTASSLRTGGASSPFGKAHGAVAKLRKSGSVGTFVASSPARTRLRARKSLATRHAMGSSLTLDLRVAPSPAKAKARRAKPTKVVAFTASQHEADDEAEHDAGASDREEEHWIDDSPPRRRRPTREAKRKAEAKIQAQDDAEVDLSLRDASQSEDFDDQSYEMGDMSVDGSPLAIRREKAKGMTANSAPALLTQGIARRTRTRTRTVSSAHSADVSEAAIESSSDLSEETAEGNGRETQDEEQGESDGADDDDQDEDMSETEMMASPSKVRRLRNGKLRMPSLTEVPRMSKADEEHDMSLDEQEEAADEDDLSDEEGDEDPDDEHDDDDDDTSPTRNSIMANPTPSTLSRLRRAVLLDYCQARSIDVPKAVVKADLISALMEWHEQQEQQAGKAPASHATAKPDSASSMETAKAGSDQEVEAQASVSTPQRGTDASDRSLSHINTPILLRTKPRTFKSPRPPSPKLNPQMADAQPAIEGTDELHGLDLESLNLVDKEIAPSKLHKLDKIGSGGFKDVYVGTLRIHKSRTTKVAISDIRDHLTEMDIKELSLLRDLQHPNIVRFIGVSIPEAPRHCPCMIVTELCTNGDLFDYIRTVAPPSDEEVYRIMLDIAQGLEYLHSRDPAIIHRDIKSTNVFITGRGQAKLGDFGLARVKQTMRSKMRSLVGTVNWQAPELWHPKPIYNEKIDVWSAAMTFWELTQWYEEVKRYPFEEMSNEHMVYLEVGQKKVRPPLPDRYHEVHSLLDTMWHHDPRKRPSMASVVTSMREIVDAARASSGRPKR